MKWNGWTLALAWGKPCPKCFDFYRGKTIRLVLFWRFGLYWMPTEFENLLEYAVREASE
jgi:hypothetical protein